MFIVKKKKVSRAIKKIGKTRQFLKFMRKTTMIRGPSRYVPFRPF